MAKHIPTNEELEQIRQACCDCTSIAAVARTCGLSTYIVTRIIHEQGWEELLHPLQEQPKVSKSNCAVVTTENVVKYNGLAPEPFSYNVLHSGSYYNEQNQLFAEIIANEGLL